MKESIYENSFIFDDDIEYYTIEYRRKMREYIKQRNEIMQYGLKFNVSPPTESPLIIKPIRMVDYLTFQSSINCLLLEKNKVPDPKIISMSYLDYLIHLIEIGDDTSNMYAYMFLQIVKLSCGVTEEDLNSGNFTWIKDKKSKNSIMFNKVEYTRKDFDEIREIICDQNFIELPDDNIDAKFKKAMDDARKFKNRNSKKMGGIEDQIICVSIGSNLSMEEIKGMTIRKFQKFLQRIDYKLNYEICKTAEMGGMVKFEKEIPHWRSEIIIDKYSDLMVDFKSVENKVTGKTTK